MIDTDPASNRGSSSKRVGYVKRAAAGPSLYTGLGFRCGLEIHQQLATEKKLFCRCPARRYQDGDDYDAQLIRHMRPTLSELGEYDGTALMEFKTKKNIVYRIKGETACTYDIDDTPPFAVNQNALDIAIEVAMLLRTSIVGELHITRKQYLDGSIPTGFQRTAIVGIEGEITLPEKRVRIFQLSLEEDSCREVSDVGHERTYTTDRLGIPLIETVTYPELLTPDEAATAANHLRYLVRSTGKVNVGAGAARQDVNVSIAGGTRVEIKGVQHIRWIPDLTHNEAFRQRALLLIAEDLAERGVAADDWAIDHVIIDPTELPTNAPENASGVLVRLPGFAGLLSFFTNPGRCFADELSDRLKVIACVEKPNMTHSEDPGSAIAPDAWDTLRQRVSATDADALIVAWGPQADIPMVLDTIDERCRLAFDGVPNETRKALADGTTIFERVLPGPDRMYPDTDSAPIPIPEDRLIPIRETLPDPIEDRRDRLQGWRLPQDARTYILRRNLFDLLTWMIEDAHLDPTFAGCLLGHTVRHAAGDAPVDASMLRKVAEETLARGLTPDLLHPLFDRGVRFPLLSFEQLLDKAQYVVSEPAQVLSQIPTMVESAAKLGLSGSQTHDWIMGQLRPAALGNVPLGDLAAQVQERVS